MPNILIFDYDGVLVDSLEADMKIYNQLCQKYNLQKINKPENFSKLLDKNFFEILAELGLSKNQIRQYMLDFKEQLELHQDQISLFGGIKEVLKTLATNNKLIIITSNSTSIVKNYLVKHNINEIEEVIGADIETSKVKKILSIKNKYPNTEIYYIGDTTGDIIEGKHAKVKTVAATWGWHARDKLVAQNPDFIIGSPKELKDLFK
jgi:phosphoglycolate phosphatase